MAMSVEDVKREHLQANSSLFAADKGEIEDFPIFEAVGNRCAFAAEWSPGIRESRRIAAVLKRAGLGVRIVDPVDELQSLMAHPWRLDLHLKLRTSERAAQWAYGRMGVRIPRSVLEQLDCGEEIMLDEVERGDLIFARSSGVTHLLGLATGSGSVIGVRRGGGLLDEFSAIELTDYQLLARRPISRDFNVVTILSRSELEIFDSRDIDRLLFRFDR